MKLDSPLPASLVAERELSRQAVEFPGLFDAVPDFVPYLWERAVRDGAGRTVSVGRQGRTAALILVSDRDRDLFPELKDTEAVLIWRKSGGRFGFREVNLQEARSLMHRAACQYARIKRGKVSCRAAATNM